VGAVTEGGEEGGDCLDSEEPMTDSLGSVVARNDGMD
jgi:hypothetical protein